MVHIRFVLVLSPSPNPNLVELEVQEIMQWNANFGYCGEASFMHLGLRYGQYISQVLQTFRANKLKRDLYFFVLEISHFFICFLVVLFVFPCFCC
jgi:hypothetical protein